MRPGEIYRAAKYVHVGGTVIEKKGEKPYRRDVTKGRKCRNIGITTSDIETIDAFMELLRLFCGDLPSNAPLLTVDGGYLRPNSVSRAFTTFAGKIEMPQGFVFHDLRHHTRNVASDPRRRPENRFGAIGARGRSNHASHLRPRLAGARRIRRKRLRASGHGSHGRP